MPTKIAYVEMDENAKQSQTVSKKTFLELGLNEWLVTQCKAVGIVKPTPIQLNCLPKIIEGREACVSDNMCLLQSFTVSDTFYCVPVSGCVTV